MDDLSVREIFNLELKKERRHNLCKFLFLAVFLIAILLLVFFYFFHLLEISGMATIVSKAGYITEANLHRKISVDEWGGIYGFALTVPGVSEVFFEDLDSGTISRSDVFFDCIQQDAPGGPEIFASTSSSLDFTNVTPANLSEIDSFIGCSGKVYCANETFTHLDSFMLGSTNITNVPTTYTYRYDGNQSIFKIGALNVSDNITFVASVQGIQKGFSQNVTVNFQMLLPTPVNTTQRYYFFNDPNDVCPTGGVGNSINSTLYGYVFDQDSTSLEGANVNVAGYSDDSNASGFYNVSFNVIPGTYNIIVTKNGYDTGFGNVTINFSDYVVQKNFTLQQETIVNGTVQTFNVTVFGKVKDTAGSSLSGVNVSVASSQDLSDSNGDYSLVAPVTEGTHPIVAFKQDYDNYYAFVNFNTSVSVINHNITLEPSNFNLFATGPYAEQEDDKHKDFDQIKEIAEKLGQDFWIAPSEINLQVRKNTFIEQKVSIYNFKDTSITLLFSVSFSLSDFVYLDKTSMSIAADSASDLIVTIYGTKPLGIYEGTISIAGDLGQSIPTKIEIVDRKNLIETILADIDVLKKIISPGAILKYKINLQNLLTDQKVLLNIKSSFVGDDGTIYVKEADEDVEIDRSLSLLKQLEIPKDLPEGRYFLRLVLSYFDEGSQVLEEPIDVALPIYLHSFFGVPLWLILTIISAFSFILFNFFLYRAHVDRKKRYHLTLNNALLPKEGHRSIKLGKIAETNVSAYYDLDMLTTHAIVAGATGGGKSIAAQVFIEEALMKGISVIVFDPTAQWSGMLRKCEDKKMLSFYPKFGLKQSDARAFPGNVRQITSPRQLIDINKYVNPGQIQIFTMNKLNPQQIDLFVSGVISQVFKSYPKESPELKTILVFDEVHRLLPKFGGQGRGFLQIERACREFRKWGLGVMLVSQVLSDFVGEIKANINTEVQMRVAEESDLNRIKERYGLEALKSLVRADVGVGMVQNAEYNRGLPYFINFRPILHNTRRLSDDILEKYNTYSDVIDDLEYQIEQLEQEKVDTFDLKMELKLVKDKLMGGNFTIVDIYLEGLKPRLEKQWEKIGKKPKKKEIKLVSEEEISTSLKAAQKEREKWEISVKKESKGEEEKKEREDTKIVNSLTFDNGMMVSSLKELKDVLPNVDQEIFDLHVNEEKNDIADWIGKEIDSGLGAKLRKAKTKDEILATIDSLQKKSEDKKKAIEEEKKEEEESEEKNNEGKKNNKKG